MYICQKHTIPVSVTVDRLRLSVTVDRLRISVRMKAVAGMSIYVGIQTKLAKGSIPVQDCSTLPVQ